MRRRIHICLIISETQYPLMKGAESMRKKMTILLAIGIICLLSGIIMAVLHVVPRVIPILMIGIGSYLICMMIFIFTYTRGGTLILDEMVKRVEVLSGSYTSIATLFFIFVLCIINYFYPLPLSIDGLLMTLMLFMGISFFLIRHYLMRRGKAE